MSKRYVTYGVRGQRVPLIARFWSKCDQSGGPDACWPWIGAVSDTGYGKVRLDSGKAGRAPRVAYEMTCGAIPPGHEIRHKCDNRLCINPAHLETGTRFDNMRDMVERGRWGGPRGTRGYHGRFVGHRAEEPVT